MLRRRLIRRGFEVEIVINGQHCLDGDRERALEVGCDDFDVKPVDLTRLLGKMSALLSRGDELK